MREKSIPVPTLKCDRCGLYEVQDGPVVRCGCRIVSDVVLTGATTATSKIRGAK